MEFIGYKFRANKELLQEFTQVSENLSNSLRAFYRKGKNFPLFLHSLPHFSFGKKSRLLPSKKVKVSYSFIDGI